MGMERVRIDHEAVRTQLADVCFICELIAENPDHQHHIIYRGVDAIAFLSKYPTLLGYTIVAPISHKEHVVGDFSEAEFVALQRLIHRIGSAIQRVVETERLYVMSLGSQQANSHVHWHLAPLPPGVAFAQQQYRALDRDDYLSVPDETMAQLAVDIGHEIRS